LIQHSLTPAKVQRTFAIFCSFSLEEKEPKRIASLEILPGIPEKNRPKTNEVANTASVALAEWFS
jgi:hypothetical protein